MGRTARTISLALVCVRFLGMSIGTFDSVRAQTAQRCFAETGFRIEGMFRQIWEQNGGLLVFGFPTAAQQEAQVNGQTFQTQWFQRQWIELHPENAAPYNMLLGRLGAERLAEQGRDWWQFPCSEAKPGCRYFAETGHNICDAFLTAWRAHGIEFDGRGGTSEQENLALFGMPLSDAATEVIDGQSYIVQWFERARFELHSELAPPYNVLFGLLGNEVRVASGNLPAEPATTLTPQPVSPEQTRTPMPRTNTPRPTSRPGEPTNTPQPTTRPGEPTNTRVVPTNTPQPTNTRVVPTNTPVPTSPFQPPPSPTVPPGFGGYGGLPSNGTGIVSDVVDLNAANDVLYIGTPVCLQMTGEYTPTQDMRFTVTGPQSTSEQVSEHLPQADFRNLVRWRWVPRPGYPTGIYTITAEQIVGGTVVSTTTGTVTIADPAPGSGGTVVAVRVGSPISETSVSNCNDGVHGVAGDQFLIILTGFNSQQHVDLYMYGTAITCSSPNASDACFFGQIASVAVDAKGQAIVTLQSSPSDAQGGYLVVTGEQALDAATNGLSNLSWEQRIELDQTNQRSGRR